MKKILFLPFIYTLAFSNSITIYNNNLAHIYESRDFNLTSGVQNIKYTNLPSSLIVDSISPDFKGDGVKLLSQSYQNNQLDINKLLKANLNEDVSFYSKERDKKLLKGKLININPNVIKTNKHYYVVDGGSIIFNKLPTNIDYKPYLEWKIDAKEPKVTEVDLSYLITGVSWSSNYTVSLNGKRLNFKAWATIVNRSGKEFKDFNVSLIAGSVNRRHTRVLKQSYKKMAAAPMVADAAVVAPKSISGYYLYNLPSKITLLNNQSKQIVIIDAKDIGYVRYGENFNNNFSNYGERKLNFAQIIEFKNSKENHLGLPLPQGLARVYKDKHYMGDDRVKNRAVGEKVKLNIGELFDIKGVQKITKYVAREKYRNVETTYTLKNSGKDALAVKINESIPRFGEKVSFKTSCKDNCSYKEKNALNREFTIVLKPKQEYKFTTEFEVYY